MNFIYIYFFLILFITPSSYGQTKKENSIYFQGTYGRTIASDDDKDRPSVLDDYTLDHKLSTGYQLALGWRQKFIAIEAVYGDLGSPKLSYDSMFSVQKSVHFAGAGFHFFWWIFDLKFGWAAFRGSRKFEIESNPDKTVSIDDMNSRITSGGAYFGLALNFNLSEGSEIVFDYTGYVHKEKKITYTIDGSSETFPYEDESSDGEDKRISGFTGIMGIGLRFFF